MARRLIYRSGKAYLETKLHTAVVPVNASRGNKLRRLLEPAGVYLTLQLFSAAAPQSLLFESSPLLGPRAHRVWFTRRAEAVPFVRGDDLGSGVRATAGADTGSTRAISCEVPAVKVGQNL